MSVDKKIRYILSNEKRIGTYRGCLVNKLITLNNMLVGELATIVSNLVCLAITLMIVLAIVVSE